MSSKKSNNNSQQQPAQQQPDQAVDQQPTQQPDQAVDKPSQAEGQGQGQADQQPTTKLYASADLLKAFNASVNSEKLKAEIASKHELVKQTALELEFSETQVDKLRAKYGITADLQADLQAVSVSEAEGQALQALQNSSAAVWSSLVSEVNQASALLESVNTLRLKLGQQPFFIAYTGVIVSSKGKRVVGDNGSGANNTGRAKYMRPGLVYVNFSGMTIELKADLENITVSVPGTNLVEVHKQGEIVGMHSMFVGFVRNTLKRETTNLSVPAVLAKAHYDPDEVYMYEKPTEETALIKQPVRVPTAE